MILMDVKELNSVILFINRYFNKCNSNVIDYFISLIQRNWLITTDCQVVMIRLILLVALCFSRSF
ncbi:MAG: hypothetical protein OFPII_11370 [Osedax symbiont Rs1]|nr:MAG: hypothetical protein OFPII_11370 [Osedax symbiont Rs1]